MEGPSTSIRARLSWANATGANSVRPHMIFFNSTGTHAVRSFVASGHVVFFDAEPCQAAGVRPDNAPICPFVASDNGPAFVTLRGGGLFVVDHTTWLPFRRRGIAYACR